MILKKDKQQSHTAGFSHGLQNRWAIITILLLFFVFSGNSFALQVKSELFNRLTYRHIGPQGNRMIAVIGVPGDLNTYYAGAASGGLWKSTDGGIDWQPIFDDQPAQSVSAVAIAPSDHNVIWASTGETFIRSNVSIGNGIYKSCDAGKTWRHMGLQKSGRIGRIVIDPRNPDVVFAAVMGHCYGPQPERGVFRTTNGGKTWERVLSVDEKTGCSDIAIDPNNPRILFAGMWQVVIKTWGRWSGGTGSGVFMSSDGGGTWKRLSGHGLPDTPMGKIAVAVAQSNSNSVYALIETGSRGSLWRSDNGGIDWKRVSHNRLLNERPHYYTRVLVSPGDHNEVYFPSNRMSISYDGGETSEMVNWGGDTHDMWVDPTNADRIMVGDDMGVLISTNHGRGWNRVVLPVAQMYHVSVDRQIPYFVYGNRQDGMSYRGPSNSLVRGWGGGIPSGMWRNVAGCECGFTYADPEDMNIIWGGCYNAELDRFDLRTGHNRSVRVWPKSPMGAPAGLLKYRFNWTFPIALSPHNHNKVYVDSQHVHVTTNGGQSWTVISPDLSTNDSKMLSDSGGLTRDNLGVEYGCIIFAIAESPLVEGLIWVGTNDGLVHVTRDGGTTWLNVTKNLPKCPPLGTVSNIEPSRYEAGTCYITIDLHQVNNRDPYIYRTTDYGKTWKLISANIPKNVFSYVHCVREDPRRQGLLYAGTENALYVTFNDGSHWVPLQTNLPHAPVHWLTVQDQFNDLVVATYGRGFWIMDDITPLQQLNRDIINSSGYLFKPREAYRFRNATGIQGYPNDQCTGRNPVYGASLNYYLSADLKEPVKITILNGNIREVRTFNGPAKAGINRAHWDLRHESPAVVKLRTKPANNPLVWEEKRFKKFARQGWVPLMSWGIRDGLIGPVAVPGEYTVKLQVKDREFIQKLTIIKDPHSSGSEAGIRAQVSKALEIRENINTVVSEINRIEWLRKQIVDLTRLLKGKKELAPVIKEAKKLDEKLFAVEGRFFQPVLAEGDLKSFRAPVKLYSQLALLAGDIASGSADFPPTNQQVEVHNVLKAELAEAQNKLQSLIENDLPALNKLLKVKKLSRVALPPSK
ncbi:WD40/YVTN/BNR-like repeat-containing protein [Acidobacteriota bacterium]